MNIKSEEDSQFANICNHWKWWNKKKPNETERPSGRDDYVAEIEIEFGLEYCWFVFLYSFAKLPLENVIYKCKNGIRRYQYKSASSTFQSKSVISIVFLRTVNSLQLVATFQLKRIYCIYTHCKCTLCDFNSLNECECTI